MNIRTGPKYEYSYNLANSRENCPPPPPKKKKKIAAGIGGYISRPLKRKELVPVLPFLSSSNSRHSLTSAMPLYNMRVPDSPIAKFQPQ